MEPDVLKVQAPNTKKRKLMTMLVDTGAVGFHVYDKRRRLLTRGKETRDLPKRSAIDVGDGCRLLAEPLEEVASNDDDFIAGISFFSRHGAVLDYARHTITFLLDSQWRKVTMGTRD
ncbi:hypothetical protein GWK47_022504 [Chionoecetes opilio]|uniref:Uncharacterized protein n=1 Tax=Chionoecetes opilio TaxID=41210 RepID=A0A8J4XNI1_CHIOP|nr:hypothetical protein GWK47_022504 [Chionoecetes opilio]